MSFWSDASPIVKGAIIVGGLGLIYLLVAFVGGLPPYGAGDEEVTQQRGLSAGGE